MKLTKTQLRQMIQEAASEYVWGVKNPGRVANKYKISVLKKLIKEELEVTLTNEEAGEMFGEDIQSQLNELLDEPEDEASPEPEFGKGKLATTQARQSGIKQAKGAGASGINDKERAILKTVLDKLQATASAGDITTGRPLALMKQLLAALDKLG